MYVIGGHIIKYADRLTVCYPNNIFIEIFVGHFQHLTQRSETGTWDMTLFRKENVDHIEIWNNVECINGCIEEGSSMRKGKK